MIFDQRLLALGRRHNVPSMIVFLVDFCLGHLPAAVIVRRVCRLRAARHGGGYQSGIGVLYQRVQRGIVLDFAVFQFQRVDFRAAAPDGDVKALAGDALALKESPRSAFFGRLGFPAADLRLVIVKFLFELFVLFGVFDLRRVRGLVFFQGVLDLSIGVSVPGRKMFADKRVLKLFRDFNAAVLCGSADKFTGKCHFFQSPFLRPSSSGRLDIKTAVLCGFCQIN